MLGEMRLNRFGRKDKVWKGVWVGFKVVEMRIEEENMEGESGGEKIL